MAAVLSLMILGGLPQLCMFYDVQLVHCLSSQLESKYGCYPTKMAVWTKILSLLKENQIISRLEECGCDSDPVLLLLPVWNKRQSALSRDLF